MRLYDFEKWMDEWQGYDEKTTKMYVRTIKQFFGWLSKKGVELNGADIINAGLVRDYRNHLAKSTSPPKKPSTINKSLQVIRIYCRWAIEEGLIRTNPALRIQYIEEPILAPKSLSETHVNILRSVIKSKSLKTQVIIELGLSAGLRVSEATNLKISDLRLKKGRGEIYVRVGKGFKFRTVPIAPDLVMLLKEYLAERTDQNGYVFVSQRLVQKLSTRAIQKMVEKLREEEEMGFYFTYHSLRHTYCSDLLNSGMKLTDVALVAGHLKKTACPTSRPLRGMLCLTKTN